MILALPSHDLHVSQCRTCSVSSPPNIAVKKSISTSNTKSPPTEIGPLRFNDEKAKFSRTLLRRLFAGGLGPARGGGGGGGGICGGGVGRPLGGIFWYI